MVGPDHLGIDPRRVAFVHDALAFMGGAERTLSAMLELFPEAPVYTLIYNRKELQGTLIARHPIYPSRLNNIPGIHRRYRSFLPFFPFLVEQFDLRGYEVVISSSYAVAHGALVDADQLHIAYLYTPMRHAWHDHAAFIRRSRQKSAAHSWMARLVLHYFRLWDVSAARRPDQILAASELVAARVQRYYRRSAQVLYPPVDVDRYRISGTQALHRSYYLVVSRLRPHKMVSIIVQAFNNLGYPLYVVGEGDELRDLSKIAGQNIRFLGRQSDKNLRSLLAGAKALVHAAEEDFGITMVEAQAAGCPVIAYGRGGALETILPEITGILFPEQSVDSLSEAVRRFESNQPEFNVHDLFENANRFSKQQFQDRFRNILRMDMNRSAILGPPDRPWYSRVPHDLLRKS